MIWETQTIWHEFVLAKVFVKSSEKNTSRIFDYDEAIAKLKHFEMKILYE